MKSAVLAYLLGSTSTHMRWDGAGRTLKSAKIVHEVTVISLVAVITPAQRNGEQQ